MEFLKSDDQFNMLPNKIVNTIMSEYLFKDVFGKFDRFFN